MTSTSDPGTSLSRVLSRHKLEEVRNFWFAHVPDDAYLSVPSHAIAAKWFSQDDDFDALCRTKFGDTLRLIQSIKPSATQIVSIAGLESPLDWVSLIILLDQIPRNCYRQDQARIAYEFFDSIVLDIALRAIAERIPEHKSVRFRHAYRFWFYMPLEHSEKMEMQDMVEREHAKMFQDTRLLIDGDLTLEEDAGVSEHRHHLLSRTAEYETWVTTLQTIAKQHKKAIERFGRYPHRNRAMGRTSTPEEMTFLENN